MNVLNSNLTMYHFTRKIILNSDGGRQPKYIYFMIFFFDIAIIEIYITISIAVG